MLIPWTNLTYTARRGIISHFLLSCLQLIIIEVMVITTYPLNFLSTTFYVDPTYSKIYFELEIKTFYIINYHYDMFISYKSYKLFKIILKEGIHKTLILYCQISHLNFVNEICNLTITIQFNNRTYRFLIKMF